MYRNCIKRLLDFIISLVTLLVFSPIFIILMIIGFISLGGNPFFVQKRPGKNEKIFNMIKFRSMSNKKDKDGNLLKDKDRITSYGNFIRKTSIDELPELVNVLIGDMSLVGPRPLLVEYLPYYTNEEKHRHDVRPGITGLAQINGRNYISWEETFKLDVEYTKNITFINDASIIFKTISKIIKRDDITDATDSDTDSNGVHVHDALNIERGKRC